MHICPALSESASIFFPHKRALIIFNRQSLTFFVKLIGFSEDYLNAAQAIKMCLK